MKFESLGAEEKKMIKHVEKNNIFVLETKSFHYVLGIDGAGFNRHIHWGEKCDVNDYEFEAVHGISSNDPALNGIKQEITPFGSTMYRECDIKARFEDGCREIFLVYRGFEQNGDTLKLHFEDEYYPLGVTLCYEVFEEYDIIKRYVTLTNTGSNDIVFERIFSAEFTLPSSEPYTFRNTNGTYGSEFLESDTLLNGGDLVFETRKGGSNHNNSPYFIAYQNADERGGDVFFATLAFSGNFKVWFVMDCGGEIGDADKYIRQLCSRKSFDYMGVKQIVMPENYVAMFGVPNDEQAARIIEKAQPDIADASETIKAEKKFAQPRRNAYDKLMSDIVNPVFYKLFVKADAFTANDKCIG